MSDCIVPQQNGHQIDELRELGRSVGWTDKEVKAVSTLTNAGDHARERTQSIAGRWITKPEYLSQLASLRQHWEELSVENRPRFPLQRPSLPENEIPAHRILRSPKIDQFGQLLTSFLDRWQLMQLTTWEIAEPQGLLVISPEGVAKGEHSLSIPVAFPLQIQDGVGPEQIRLHELLAKNREIEDLSRFDTYRQIWRIDFLENILQRRYTEFRQKRGFQSKLLSLIGKYLDLDTDRIKKYRSWRNRLRTGETSSLRGLR